MKPKSHIAILLAASLALALGACSSSSEDDPPVAMTDSEPEPEPVPEPDPGPSDLDETQTAAADAAKAAMDAADAAKTKADAAAAATANIATLQTGGTAAQASMDAGMYAKAAMDAADAAKAASDAAAAAETGPDAESAWRMAENAKDDAEAASKMAVEKADAAIEAAMTELHVDGTMKMVGDSSIDATMGMLTKTADDGSKTITGMLAGITRKGAGAVTGQAFAHKGAGSPVATEDKAYKQAVEARDLVIGKTLDTTDDAARLRLVTAHVGSKMYRVFADDGSPIEDAAVAKGKVTITGVTDAVTLKSLGMFIEATEGQTGDEADALDHTDLVMAKTGTAEDAPANKPVEVFTYNNNDGEAQYVVEVSRVETAGVITSITLQPVDITAVAAPDSTRDGDNDNDEVRVMAAVPSAVKYSHIHFGVWAALSEAKKDGSQTIADLGIGFVQNHSGSGMPTGTGIGTATFNGDWVAAVQRESSETINLREGEASLLADFGKSTVKATLTDLATLEGSLSGYAFSGTKATIAASNADLNSSGTFMGSFSGGIYGPAGDEAAGVFSFMGGEAGSFRGAFGGTSKQ